MTVAVVTSSTWWSIPVIEGWGWRGGCSTKCWRVWRGGDRQIHVFVPDAAEEHRHSGEPSRTGSGARTSRYFPLGRDTRETIALGSAGHAAARPGAGREKGSTLEPWTLQDQFEKAHSLDDSTRVLLVARDMDGSEAGQGGAGGTPKGLPGGAPRAVPGGHQPHAGADFPAFAVPAMRDYSYPVLLDRDAAIASRLCLGRGQGALGQAGAAPRVEIRQLDSPVALRIALEQLQP